MCDVFPRKDVIGDYSGGGNGGGRSATGVPPPAVVVQLSNAYLNLSLLHIEVTT
jgi:hypothetical protein